MSVEFNCLTIDNHAIYAVIDQLLPYLKYDPDSEYRVLDLDKEGIEEKHLILYEDIFLPYCAESSRHFWRHHRNDSHVDASWYGEQTCLSMIHAINEKARWLLCLFAVEEAIAEHYIIPKKRMDIIVRGVTCSVIDGGAAVHDAVNYWIDDSCKLKKKNKRPGQADIIRNIIIQSITEKIEEYENRPSKRMQYR